MRSQNPHSLNHDERLELWNLENEQFEELIIQPSLSYYNRFFERGAPQTDGGLGWRNIWRRLQEDDAACLQLLRMSLGVFRSLCDILQSKYGLHPTLNVSIEESVTMFLRISGHNEVQRDVGLRFGRTQETSEYNFFLKFLGRQSYLLVIILRLQQDENYFEFLKGYKWTEDIGHILVDL